MQAALSRGVAKYPQRQVLAGHSSAPRAYKGEYGRVFERLHEVEAGAKVRYDGKAYHVKEKRIVWPSDLSVLDVPEEELRIFTCYPPNTTDKRLVLYLTRGSGGRQRTR